MQKQLSSSDIIPGPAYRIHTRRLVIRCWNPLDAPLLKEAIDANLEHLRPWLYWAEDEPQELQQKIELIRRWRSRFDQGIDFTYGVFSRGETRVLGGTGLHTRLGEGVREIGYWIHKEYINQGLATELAAALTQVAFEVDHVHRVEIHCDPDNVRSSAVPTKLHYTLEAILPNRLQKPDGTWRGTMIWTLFEQDYPSSPPASAEIEAFDAAGRKII